MAEERILYRYFKLGRGVEALKKKQLYFSDVTCYNDPYELIPAADVSDFFCKIPSNPLAEIQQILKDEQGLAFLRAIEDKDGISGSAMAGVAMGGLISFTGTLALLGLYHLYKKLGEDDKEQKERLIDFAICYFPVLNSSKTCCFSEVADDLLLWAHYADSHKGIVIGFSSSLNYWPTDHWREVTYSNTRIKLPEKDTEINEYVWRMLTRKARCWQYEKEWRIISFRLKRDNHLIDFNPDSVKEIRIGLNVEEKARQRIIDCRNRYYPNATIYQAKRNKSEFKLDFEAI